ncbi:hypothetical protein KR032_008090, partial [Drosophila birchii]
MDTLRQKISELFVNNTPKTETIENGPKPEDLKISADTLEPISTGDSPMPDLNIKTFNGDHNLANFDYEVEFVEFLDRNTPKGLSKKFMDMLPYLEISFLSWPAYWIYRGYNWQYKRNTERISVYIQRTYQQAKLMQVAILATGAFAVAISR